MAESEHPRRAPRKDDDPLPHDVQPHEPPPMPAPGGPRRGPLAFLRDAQDVMTVRRVFGEPIERDGLTIIPAARIRGGGGGGFGEGPDRAGGRGGGGGYGVVASPAGAYVIKDGTVTWKPAINATRIALMGQVVAIVALLTVRSVVRALAKRR